MQLCGTILKGVFPVLRALMIQNLIEKFSFIQVKAAQNFSLVQLVINYYFSFKQVHKNLQILTYTLI